MNHEEAKFVLSAYRPGGQDSEDPRIQEALEYARRDPILSEWLRKQTEQDAAISRSLRSISVPENLRAQILAGAKVTGITEAKQPKKKTRWLPHFVIPTAAAALIATAVYIPLHNATREEMLQNALAKDELAGWQMEAIQTVSAIGAGHAKFDAMAPSVHKLESWLAENNGTTVSEVPQGLESLTSLGCKTIQWKGRTVSIVCFQLDKDHMVHMVVIDRHGLHQAPPEGKPQFIRKGDWATASWSQGDQSVMLATQGSEDTLRKLL